MEFLYTASNEIMESSLQYAKDVGKINEGFYATRGQTNDTKMMMDAYYGKIAEWAVYEYLIKLDLKPIEPDMEVYEVEDKSFDADIQTINLDFHVKCCEERLNPSWVFQKDSDPLVTKPDERDLIAVTVHSVECPVQIQILKVFKALDVIDYYDDLFSEELTKRGKTSLYWGGRIDKKNKKINELENIFTR